MKLPLPWERLLWSGRPVRPRALVGERYFLTDFRLVRVSAGRASELVLHEIHDVRRLRSRVDRLLGTSTIIVAAKSRGTPPLVLVGVRRGAALAALVDLLSGDPHASIDGAAVKAALSWDPLRSDPPVRGSNHTYRDMVAAAAIALIAMFAVVIGLHGNTARLEPYAPDDPLIADGVKRDRAEVMRFMEREVMPWARVTLGRIKGGPQNVTCETCHGPDAVRRDWQMPAVAALPQPVFKDLGWELYGGRMDAQMRNAIYGYLAESEKQTKATFMREVVMPGMAHLLRRPAYDFTQPYDYNRSRHALGCYHCHKVS